MEITFPYAGYEEIESASVPEANLFGVYAPHKAGDVNEDDVLAQGFAICRNAINGRPLNSTPQEALDMGFQRQGRAAKVAVLQHGGHILPLIKNDAKAA